MRVANTGTNSTTSWNVTLTFPNGQRITQVWGGRTTQTASPFTVTNETWNGTIAAGQGTNFGFSAVERYQRCPQVTCSRTPYAVFRDDGTTRRGRRLCILGRVQTG